jgi:beta-glucanase (GH16 family)
MRKMHLIVMFLGILSLLSVPAFAGTLVWSDEFDGNNIDFTKWTFDIGTGSWGWGNGELENYTARPDNVYIESGSLVIQAKRENYLGSSFTSARLKTIGRMAFQYGTIEARIKIPNLANGLWPAFWLLGNNVGSTPWPACGEVDILEMGMAEGIATGTQNKKHSAGAFWDYLGTTANYYLQVDAAVNLNNDYHLYKLSWTPTMMTAYLDGISFWSLDISNPSASSLEEFHRPLYVLMNMAVGGENFVHITDPGAITAPLPAKLYVDWIRLYDDGYTQLYTSANTAENGNFGVFTETTPVENHITYGTDANLYIWNDMTATTTTPYEGAEAWSFNIGGGTWWGMGVLCLTDRNMKNYSDGYLHVHIKTTTTQTFKIGIKSTAAGEFWLPLVNGGEEFGLVRDGSWHEVMIPLNRFANIDFPTISQIFMIAGDAAAAFNISLDNIYWSKSIERPTPANGNFGVFTENTAHKNAGAFALGADGNFFVWENTLVPRTKTPYEGTDSMSLQSAPGLTWFGAAFTPNVKHNLTAFRYSESRLHFALKTSSTVIFQIGMKSGNVDGIGQKWITFQNGSDPYGFVRDGIWHVIDIPMTDISGEVDLSQVSQLFELLGTTGPITNIEIDDICFTGGGEPVWDEPGGNRAPTASITSPANGTIFSPGSDITINATASDSDGNVTQVEFFSGTNSLGVDTTSPYSITWHSVPAGTYILTARATDNNDANGVSSPVTVYVGTPALTSITVTPSSAVVAKGDAQQFTAVGYNQFGQTMTINPAWSVTGGGAIDSLGEFIATTIGGPFTVKAQVGAIYGTAAVTVQMYQGVCTGGPSNGDYTYQASGASSNPTITFIPGSTGVGSPTCILYYSTSPTGVYPGYMVTPNVPYQITASAGQTIYFYYTYSFPGQGEHSTVNNKHSFVVGSCVSAGPADLNGNGFVNFIDFAILANNWLHDDCGSVNSNCSGADFQPDGKVDFKDVYYMSLFWLN